MTLHQTKLTKDNGGMVLLPKHLKSVAAAVLIAFFGVSLSASAWAEMPPHGRPGNLTTLPGVSLGVAGGVNNELTQAHVYLEAKTSHRFMLFIGTDQASGQLSDVAINGDVDVEFSGVTYGFYYQLPNKFSNSHITLALRYQDGDTEDDAVILSGASRVDLIEERTAKEATVLVEHENWARGFWQPYVGIGFQVSNTNSNISTSGGRDITSSELNENTAEFTAGLHYQRNRLSAFLEGNASSSEDSQWSLNVGVRFGFFHRPKGGS